MKRSLFKTLGIALVGLLLAPGLAPSALGQAKPAADAKAPADAKAQKDKVETVVKKPVKSRKLPIIYSAKDGDKVLKYIFKPKARPGGKNVLVVWGVRGTKAADLKAVKKGTPAYAKMIADKKKEQARRARAARLIAQGKKKVAAAETGAKFTSDEDQIPGQESTEVGSAPSGDIQGKLNQIETALDELEASVDSEDPEAYDGALEKLVTAIDQAKNDLAASGDTESAALLQSLQDTLVGKENVEGSEEDEEEGFVMEDDEEGVEEPVQQ